MIAITLAAVKNRWDDLSLYSEIDKGITHLKPILDFTSSERYFGKLKYIAQHHLRAPSLLDILHKCGVSNTGATEPTAQRGR